MTEVIKGWGKEVIFASTDTYCGKFLEFSKAGNRFSMHFHRDKDETWVVMNGSFKLTVIKTEDATVLHTVLKAGDTWRNFPLVPHQLEALEDKSVIVEVSTRDDPSDNFRVAPGDSQSEGDE